MITLYSTNCPRCSVLEKKLDNAGIDYSINNDVDEMVSLGFIEVPTLVVDGEVMTFKEAVDWINGEQRGK